MLIHYPLSEQATLDATSAVFDFAFRQQQRLFERPENFAVEIRRDIAVTTQRRPTRRGGARPTRNES